MFFGNFDLENKFLLFYRLQIAFQIAIKALKAILFKYANFADVFPSDYAIILPEYNGINNYFIDSIDRRKPYYNFNDNGEPVKLEILNIYIEINLINNFIQSFKSHTNLFIFFV